MSSIAAAALCLAVVKVSAAPQQEEHVRGVIGAADKDAVTVKTADGRAQQLKLADKLRVSLATRADLNAIAKGAYVGVTAMEAKDGTLRAVEVHVFPESARGAGEGHRPWDLKPGSTMTNANVAEAEAEASKPGAPSTMTNANVADVSASGGGKKLTLSYPGGQKRVIVPPGTTVVRMEPADRSALTAGRHVFAAGPRQPDGTMLAERMVVGKDGVVPPM